MRYAYFIFCLLVAPHALCNDKQAVSDTIDALHKHASDANGDAYFSLFSDNAIFIGTDAKETWTISQFKTYATPFFSQGKGWTYHVTLRNIYFSKEKNVAWFDEMLQNDSLGETRGTGVLEKIDGKWKIAQYHLTVPIPNELVDSVADQIKNFATPPAL